MNTNNKGFTEKDWKLFRNKIGKWQENYIDRLNEEYIKILRQDKNPSEKFWQLFERIKKDAKKPGVIIEIRKSAMIDSIVQLLRENVIQLEDLDEFSQILKDRIYTIMEL